MDTQPEDRTEQIIRDQAVKCIHLDFDTRYDMNHIRKVLGRENTHLLDGVTQNDINMLKEFFFNTIYPQMGERAERDKSFESMVKMLKQPARLGRFIPSLPLLVLRYARVWPTAVNVGVNAMMAYLYSLRIEELVTRETIAILQEKGAAVDEHFDMDMALYEQAFVRVPYSHSKRMLTSAVKVMKAGKNPQLVKTTRNILDDVRGNFERLDKPRIQAGQPPMYQDIIRALNFGETVLNQVQSVFGSLGEEKLTRVIRITEINEMQHIDTLYGKS
jgi:hypothetical protein